MTNEQILNKRWNNIDKYLADYLKKYNDINQDTKYEIQDIFDSLNISYSDINKPISKSKKDRLDKFILKLQKDGLLGDYFGYRARLILNKKKVTYSELLEIMIMSSYIKQNKSFDEYNNILFFNVCENAYNQGIGDIVKIKDVKSKSFKLPILYTLLNIPILNMTAESYLYSLALTNADELYKQTLINLQLGKELDVDSKFYKDLFDKQNKRYISINGEKISGGIVNIVENLTNLAYLQAGIDTDIKQCRFIAEMDKRTTKMCETLNNQLFKLNGMNVYQRYSEIDKKIITYHTKGLVQGENLPPITNHFHWCRSTITYLLDENVANIARESIKVANETDKKQFSRYKKYYGEEITDDIEEFVKMKYNNADEWSYLKNNYNWLKHRYNAIEKGELTAFATPKLYLEVKNDAFNNLIGIKLTNGMKVSSMSYHFVDRIIGNISEKRNGVKVSDILTTLKTSRDIRKSYGGSYRIFGENNIVSINEQGNLIQVNPKGSD